MKVILHQIYAKLSTTKYDGTPKKLTKQWSMFVMEKLEAWRNMNLDWLRNFEKPMLVVNYEDLVLEPKKFIEIIINFIDLPIEKNHIKCMMRRKEGIYRRRKAYLPFNPFSPELMKVLENQKKVIYNEVIKRRKYRTEDAIIGKTVL